MRADCYKRWKNLTMKEKEEIIEDWNSGDSKMTIRFGKERPEKFKCADGEMRTIDEIAPIQIDMGKRGELIISPAYAGPLEWYRKHRKQWQKTVEEQTIILDDVTLAFWN